MRRSGRDLLSRSVDRESLRGEEIKAEIEREFCTPLIPRCVQATSLHSRPTLQTYGRLCLQDFPRQEFRSALPRPPPGDLPIPGIEPVSSALQADACLGDFSGGAWRSPRKGYLSEGAIVSPLGPKSVLDMKLHRHVSYLDLPPTPASSAGEGQRQRWADQTPKPTRITW